MLGCYPEEPTYVDELDIVYTNYNPAFDFKGVNTFALPEHVIKIDDSTFFNHNGNTEPEFVSDLYANIILNTIRNNMIALGWTEVNKNSNPDVILLISVSTTTTIYYYYDWYYWNWWYPGWDQGWGWYYPGYYNPVYAGGYRSGTLLIQMTEDVNTMVDKNVSVPWVVVINGLLEGNPTSIESRLSNTINQAFKQSPYLQQ
ncbi:DUF4136 domain-containing protein [Chryseotalea sanaruensis]|uniref:DUF4136 domain-containing protein n=2 Tax=Chryseotalea sanaruensis TaxID=2482724 RepID=A0A401U6E3_9BACT|nr:DUF4136 domain-containing protein [Chryseotalea sanaruensis]